ncbi:hypothetical protein DFJ73DRAFT_806692 [Zopfochytrium polystomum]|nr:hypothetical protein DFJ73DRAFT_806692 [Zopfochytrium polystomum]
MEQDLTAVLGDGADPSGHDYGGGNGVGLGGPIDAVGSGDGGSSSYVVDTSGVYDGGDGGGGVGGSVGSHRRGRSPPSYSTSSGRMRTPYERPSADMYKSGGGGGGGGGGGAGSSSADTSMGLSLDGGDGNDPSSKYGGGGRRGPGTDSRRERRVYVGNLAYEVGWQDLKDHMRKVGEVLFADVLTLPNGRSKGCGVVEFATIEEAQKAIREMNDTTLMGRAVFVREDREMEMRGGSGRDRGGGAAGGGRYRDSDAGRSVYVSNLPYIVAWQDLKDLFRQAGPVIRADVHEGPDRRSKGTGTVVFEAPGDAHNAISMYHGYEWHGRRLEVRDVAAEVGGGAVCLSRLRVAWSGVSGLCLLSRWWWAVVATDCCSRVLLTLKPGCDGQRVTVMAGC